jgi:hypothetical protein
MEVLLNEVIDRVIHTFGMMRNLSEDALVDARESLGTYFETLSSAGETDPQRLAVWDWPICAIATTVLHRNSAVADAYGTYNSREDREVLGLRAPSFVWLYSAQTDVQASQDDCTGSSQRN